MLKQYEKMVSKTRKRLETFFVTFNLDGKPAIDFQTKNLESATFIVNAMDVQLKAEGYGKLGFTRRRKPEKHITTYIYHYGRRT